MRGPGRSLRPGLLAPAVLLHLGAWFALLAHGHRWTGAWGMAVEQVAGTVIIVGPLIAGITASFYAQRQQTFLRDAVISSAHPVRGWFAPAYRLWLLAVANLLLCTAEVTALGVGLGLRLLARPLLVLPLCALVLAAHVLIGAGLGALLPPRLAGVVAATVSFAAFLLAVAGLAPDPFVTGGATSSLVGMQYRLAALGTLAGQALLVVVGLAAVAWWGRRWSWYRVALAGSTLGASLLISQLAIGDADRKFEPVDVPLICEGSTPRVCVAVDTPRILRSAATGMERYSRPLRAIGAELPERWEPAWRPGVDRTSGELSFSDGDELGTRAGSADLIQSLTRPARCGGDPGAAPSKLLHARLLLERWLAARNQVGDPHDADPWFATTASEVWVRSAYDHLRRCDLAGLRFPAKRS